jgi:hypothetical protein
MNTPLRLLALACLLITSMARAEEPPPLARPEAKQILENMEWRDVNILAIRQGVNEKGTVSPIYVTVVAFATRKAKDQPISQTLTYDRELGWHLLEVEEKQARMWNKEGYWEIKPWGTWQRMATK